MDTDTNLPQEPIQNIEPTPAPEVSNEVPEVSNEDFEIETRQKTSEEKIEYGDDVNEEDAKTISLVVEKQTASVKKALQETQDRLEVDSFLQDKPEYSKYKGVILKYLSHPVYSQIPVKNIANMVAANDLIRIGAEKERLAQQKAANTKTTGTIVRPQQVGQGDWKSMSKGDFEAQKRRILGHQV